MGKTLTRRLNEAYLEVTTKELIDELEAATGLVIDEAGDIGANIEKLTRAEQEYWVQINKINATLRDLTVQYRKAQGDDFKPIKKEIDRLQDKKLKIYQQQRKVENMIFRLKQQMQKAA